MQLFDTPKGVKLKDLPLEKRRRITQMNKMFVKAAYLSIMPNPNGSFNVWGGDSQHIVKEENGIMHCDCRGWESAAEHCCSHVMKVRLVYGDLKRK